MGPFPLPGEPTATGLTFRHFQGLGGKGASVERSTPASLPLLPPDGGNREHGDASWSGQGNSGA